MSTRITFLRHDFGVQVVCDSSEAEWLAMRCQHFFKTADDPPVHAWKVWSGLERAPVASDYVVQEWAYPSGEFVRTLVSAEARAMVIDLPPGDWRRVYLLRAVRSLLRWQLQAICPLFLHGVAMARPQDGAGFCILGPTRSGKSAASYRLARKGAWDWVSQDDLCLLPVGGEWTLLGWPGALRLRREALQAFPELTKLEAGFDHPANLPERALSAEAGLLRIFPEELSSAFGAGIRGEARVAAFFVLDPTSPFGAPCRLGPHELLSTVIRVSDLLPERRAGARVADALEGRRPWSDLLYNPQLLGTFGLPDFKEIEVRTQSLAATIPAWRLGRETLLNPGILSRLLDEALGGRASCV